MAFKDHASLVISSIALTLSAATAYYTTFSERLDVRAALTDDFVWFDFGAGTLEGAGLDSRLVLINGGNRAIALTDLALHIYQVESSRKYTADCDARALQPLYAERVEPVAGTFAALVVKPMDVTIVPIQFKADFTRRAGARIAAVGAPTRFQPDPRDPQGHIRVFACLEVRYAAPGERLRSVGWPLAWSDGESLGEGEGGAQGGQGAFEDEQTAVLVKEVRGVL